jgi:hypothetical protein
MWLALRSSGAPCLPVERELDVLDPRLLGRRVVGGMRVVERLHLLGRHLHLGEVCVRNEVHLAHLAALPGELDEAVECCARHERRVGDRGAELLVAEVLPQALVEAHDGEALRARDLLVAVLAEAPVDLEEGLRGDLLGKLLVAHADAGALGAEQNQLLVHEPVEDGAAHLAVVHDGGIELPAELLAIDLGLVAQRLVELGLADAVVAHARERVAAHGRAEIEVDPEEPERDDEEEREEESHDPLVG